MSFVSGFVDMDAITVSMAKLSGSAEGVSYTTAVRALTFASVSNTIFKGGVFALFGSRKASLRLFVVFGAMIVVGLLSLLFV